MWCSHVTLIFFSHPIFDPTAQTSCDASLTASAVLRSIAVPPVRGGAVLGIHVQHSRRLPSHWPQQFLKNLMQLFIFTTPQQPLPVMIDGMIFFIYMAVSFCFLIPQFFSVQSPSFVFPKPFFYFSSPKHLDPFPSPDFFLWNGPLHL